MFVWWFLGFIGFLSVGNIYCQGSVPALASLDVSDHDAPSGGTVNDNSVGELPKDINNSPTDEVSVTGTSSPIPSTTTTTPEPFSCHECTNCNSKSDFNTRVCEEGVTMCYEMHKRIDNTSRIIRGCSTSKDRCTASNDDQSNSFDSITCCTSHKCNQAAHFKPLLFLSTLSLFIILITIINL